MYPTMDELARMILPVIDELKLVFYRILILVFFYISTVPGMLGSVQKKSHFNFTDFVAIKHIRIHGFSYF